MRFPRSSFILVEKQQQQNNSNFKKNKKKTTLRTNALILLKNSIENYRRRFFVVSCSDVVVVVLSWLLFSIVAMGTKTKLYQRIFDFDFDQLNPLKKEISMKNFQPTTNQSINQSIN